MSSDIAIKINEIAKIFQIYDKPIDRLKQSVWGGKKQFYKEYKALNEISFDVRKGETVGIVGCNGAGKSTLLQMVCGTLTPTSGEIKIQGRVAALLELGAGFNPEFTGKENVFMSATILGLSKEEIEKRYEDIVEFAGIGEFINQPVKIYSSGMYIRLAFAVIAHVDADILVIDEALAVGDAVFVQKCMRFIRDFQRKGTLLFVSHDMASVMNLCETAVWLDNGRIRKKGISKQIAQEYLESSLQEVYGTDVSLTSKESSLDVNDSDDSDIESVVNYESVITVENNLQMASGWESGSAEITEVVLEKVGEASTKVYGGGEKVRMIVRAKAIKGLDEPIIGFIVKDKLGQDLFGENTLPRTKLNPVSIGADEIFEARFIFKMPMLPNGQYSIMVSVANGDLYNNIQHHYIHDALIINVVSSKVRWGLMGIPFEEIDLRKY